MRIDPNIDYAAVASQLAGRGLVESAPEGATVADVDGSAISANERVVESEQKAAAPQRDEAPVGDRNVASPSAPAAESVPEPEKGPERLTLYIVDADSERTVRAMRIETDGGSGIEVDPSWYPSIYKLDESVPVTVDGNRATAYVRFSVADSDLPKLRRVAVEAASGVDVSDEPDVALLALIDACMDAVRTWVSDTYSVPERPVRSRISAYESRRADKEPVVGAFLYAAPKMNPGQVVKTGVIKLMETSELVRRFTDPSLDSISVSQVGVIETLVEGSAFADTYVRGVACDVAFRRAKPRESDKKE